MHPYLVAGLMIVIASLLIAYRRGFFVTSEGFQDAPLPPGVPDPAIPEPQTADSGAGRLNDLRDLVKNTLDQVEQAGGDSAIQNKIPADQVSDIMKAIEALRGVLRLMPEPVTDERARQIQGMGVRLSSFDFTVRDQARIVQAAMVQRPSPAPAPAPAPNPEVNNEQLSDALSGLVESSETINLMENFQSFKNPYNAPSPDMTQAYEFKLGQLALTDSILK